MNSESHLIKGKGKKMNLWKDLKTGNKAPDIVNAIVEIPKGSRNKYEFSKKYGTITLNRVLFSPLHFPGDYGLIPQTYYDDGDPLDILILLNEPTFPGCVVEARPLGLFKMKDKGLPDDKVLAVLTHDPIFRDFKDISEIPQHYLKEIAHFFQVYKDLEGHSVEGLGWESSAVAKKTILYAMDLYQKKMSEKKAKKK